MITFKDALNILEDINKDLTAYDFKPQSAVMVHGIDDCTSMIFHSAFALKFSNWFLVFTEHSGNHIFHDDEFSVLSFTKPDIIVDVGEFEICDKSKKYWAKKEKVKSSRKIQKLLERVDVSPFPPSERMVEAVIKKVIEE